MVTRDQFHLFTLKKRASRSSYRQSREPEGAAYEWGKEDEFPATNRILRDDPAIEAFQGGIRNRERRPA